ncbi:efflux RND transporter periplasmic adaptor subunit [Stieleria varia]|uniref:Multidrug resistance protein MdtN n=1 Tax=Stieleria varia TaxID=2528005 RepID=A0A5C6A068_9BACT|nr:HlyD family efflux transporter periplasmic adaptor subunit [Stieleria varia]TWT92720.1 multidrug resistance protein MdtN [Stieleria varia]
MRFRLPNIAVMLSAAATLACACTAMIVHAQQPAPPETETPVGIEAEHCMVQYINKTRLPAESQGKLVKLNVEEGMTVKKGDVLAVVDDKQSQLQLQLKQAEEKEAELNAANDVNYKDAVSSALIAKEEAKAYVDLGKKGAAPSFEVEKKILEAQRADLRIELAELQMRTAKAVYMAKRFETELAKSDISMREIKADFDAFVETRIAQLGEWVQPGSPIAELVQMDRLRVEGDINALRYAGSVKIGTPVKILITTGTGDGEDRRLEIDAVIEYVSTELDMNHQYRIWASIENQRVGNDWVIKPGMTARMIIIPAKRSSGGQIF